MIKYDDLLKSKSFNEFCKKFNESKHEHEDKLEELEHLSGRTIDELLDIYRFQVSKNKNNKYSRGDVLRLTHMISGKVTQGICVGYDGDFLWVIYNNTTIPVCLVTHYYEITNLGIHNAELNSDLLTLC